MDSVITEAEKEFAHFTFVTAEGPVIEEPEEEEPVDLHCERAEKFYAWCSKLLEELGIYPSEAKINTYELYLQRHYRQWLKQLPKACQNYKGVNGTKCIHTIWLETFDAIAELRLSQMPVVFKEPPEVKVVEKEQASIGGALVGVLRENGSAS